MSWLHGWADWVTSLLRRAARDHELHEEIRFHLDMEAQRQRGRGLDPNAARHVALLKFGDVARVHEATRDARGTPYPEGYMHDLHWAARSLRKQPGFTALALVPLCDTVAFQAV